jgi:hypothetical protein
MFRDMEQRTWDIMDRFIGCETMDQPPIFLYWEVLNIILNWNKSNGTLTPQFLPYKTPKDNRLSDTDLDILVYSTTAIAPSSPSIIVFTWHLIVGNMATTDLKVSAEYLFHSFSMQFVLHVAGLPNNFYRTPKFYLLPPHCISISCRLQFWKWTSFSDFARMDIFFLIWSGVSPSFWYPLVDCIFPKIE